MFSFGFSGDDIDEEVADENINQASIPPDHLDGLHGAGSTPSEPKQIESERYGLEEWVSLRPLPFFFLWQLIILPRLVADCLLLMMMH